MLISCERMLIQEAKVEFEKTLKSTMDSRKEYDLKDFSTSSNVENQKLMLVFQNATIASTRRIRPTKITFVALKQQVNLTAKLNDIACQTCRDNQIGTNIVLKCPRRKR